MQNCLSVFNIPYFNDRGTCISHLTEINCTTLSIPYFNGRGTCISHLTEINCTTLSIRS